MVSLGQFARNIRRRGRNVEVNANRLVIETAGSILSRVVVATPVDTGRARGGWVVGLGEPNRQSNALDKSGGATIVAGRNVLRARRTEQTIYLSNNVNYIVFLDQGSSAQAPANFVAIAVRNGIRALDGQRLTE